jgi:drug/metabolite transporter (DMT)-like permease
MPLAGIVTGLLSAVSFGAGDFSGALATRRSSALLVVAGAHLVGLVLLVGAIAVVQPAPPDLRTAVLGLAAGLAGAVGLAALYRGMADGRMGLVSALGGAGSLAFPLIAGAMLGIQISTLQLVGVACAAAAGAAASGAARGELGRSGLAMAGLAAVGFGSWYVLLDLAARGGDPLWALTLSRAASSTLTACVAVSGIAIGRVERRRMPLRLIVAAGVFDVGGNAFYVLARGLVPIGAAAALSGLYPLVTTLLARGLLGERLSLAARLGVVLAVVGIGLISLG